MGIGTEAEMGGASGVLEPGELGWDAQGNGEECSLTQGRFSYSAFLRSAFSRPKFSCSEFSRCTESCAESTEGFRWS